MTYIIDTNMAMRNFDLSKAKKVYISVPVLEELDKHNHSSDQEKAYKARCGLRHILECEEKYGNIQYVSEYGSLTGVPEWLDLGIKDNLILIYAQYIQRHESEAILLTADLNMYQKAKALKIKVEYFKSSEKEIYKGYTEITGDKTFIGNYFETIDYSKWNVNQYLIINDTDEDKTRELRYEGNESFTALKLPPSSYIKAKNPLQRCALDLLANKNITTVAVLGTYGSGKSFLCTQMARYNVLEKGLCSKILGIREPRGEGKDIGYLKGTFEDKTGKFFKPIEQQLKGGEFELESLIAKGVLETSIPYYLKGTTYNNTIMLVDEAEDLSEQQIRLIGTRVGENGKIYFSGDYAQSLINKTDSNPLVKMCNELKGDSKFGCIYLDEDVRSETSKLFANLFK